MDYSQIIFYEEWRLIFSIQAVKNVGFHVEATTIEVQEKTMSDNKDCIYNWIIH